MKDKPILTEKEYEAVSQRLDILANAISGSIEAKDLNETINLKLLTREVIQDLKRLT